MKILFKHKPLLREHAAVELYSRKFIGGNLKFISLDRALYTC